MRGPPVCLRALTAEERSAVETLARSRTAPARQVERARLDSRLRGSDESGQRTGSLVSLLQHQPA